MYIYLIFQWLVVFMLLSVFSFGFIINGLFNIDEFNSNKLIKSMVYVVSTVWVFVL